MWLGYSMVIRLGPPLMEVGLKLSWATT